MNSGKLGTGILPVEVTHLSKHGLWLLVDNHEYFLDHDEFPWFRDARLSAVLNVSLPSPEHVRWPELDVDLHLESLRNPAEFPCVDRGSTRTTE